MNNGERYTLYPIVCISKALVTCSKRIAENLERQFFFIDKISEIDIELKNKKITIIGIITDIDVDEIRKILDCNIIFSVLAVKNERDLVSYYKKMNSRCYISINSVYIEDFLDSTPAISLEKLSSSNVCLFSGHGDYMCFNMESAVLCSKIAEHKTEEIAPFCNTEGKCYRRKRLRDSDAPVYLAAELKAEVLFLNTCSGVCFNNRKYDVCYGSIADSFLAGSGLLFISNYMIGAYTHHETAVFWAILIHYKNFAAALCKYNQVVDIFYKKNKAAVMIGDALIEVSIPKKEVQKRYTISAITREYVSIRFQGELTFRTVVFEIDNIELLDSLVVDKTGKCNYRLGMLVERDLLKIFICADADGVFETEIIFLNKKIYHEKCLETHKILLSSRKILDMFMFSSNYAKEIKAQCDFWINKIFENIDVQDIDNGNVEIATFAYNILKKAIIFKNEFNEFLLKCFAENAVVSDTHLILDNRKFLLRKVIKAGKKCPICGNHYWNMYMESKTENITFLQSVCPKCEIFCITNNPKKTIDFKLFSYERNKFKVSICSNQDFLKPHVSAMLINTPYQINNFKLQESKTILLDLNVKNLPAHGMYYLRVVLIEEDGMTIFHRRIYL